MKWGVLLRTGLYGLTIILITVICFIPACIVAALPASIRFTCKPYYWLEYICYCLLIRSWMVPVRFIGLENIPQSPVIFAANHQSSIDIPLLGSLSYGRPHIWLIWYGLTRYPIFGFILRRMNVIVDTRTPVKAARTLYTAYELTMGNGRDLMIFPEGGRFTDNKIHDFFAGFAMLAKKTGRPVVPVMLVNTHNVCEPNTIWIHYAPVKVYIGRPFTYRPEESDEEFLQRVRTWFVDHSTLIA